MTDAIVVLCSFATREDALRIGTALVQARLAACVNLLPPMRSIYRWKGNVEEAEEVLALLKTTADRFPALRDRLRELHSYETPEIVALPIQDGLPEYLRWLHDEVG